MGPGLDSPAQPPVSGMYYPWPMLNCIQYSFSTTQHSILYIFLFRGEDNFEYMVSNMLKVANLNSILWNQIVGRIGLIGIVTPPSGTNHKGKHRT